MTNNVKNEFSISGHLAFNPEENCNYVFVKDSRGNIRSSSDKPKLPVSKRKDNENKYDPNESNLEFKQLNSITRDVEPKTSNILPNISPITNERIPRDHVYFESSNKLVKLRSIKENPHRVKF